MFEHTSLKEELKSLKSLTPEGGFSSLSDKFLSDLLLYTKLNGMLLGYIAVVITIDTFGRIN